MVQGTVFGGVDMTDLQVKIIVVEDDPAMRQSLLSSIAADKQFKVLAACSTYAEGVRA